MAPAYLSSLIFGSLYALSIKQPFGSSNDYPFASAVSIARKSLPPKLCLLNSNSVLTSLLQSLMFREIFPDP